MREAFIPLSRPSMNVRTPVIWARGMSGIGPKEKWPSLSASYPSNVCGPRDLVRHSFGVIALFRRYWVWVFQRDIFPGGFLALLLSFLWRETKNTRKAVTAARMIPISAASTRRYVSQTRSIWPLLLILDIRVIVTKIMTTVRQREKARTAFWVHWILILQMSLTGMYNTGSKINVFFHYWAGDRYYLISHPGDPRSIGLPNDA